LRITQPFGARSDAGDERHGSESEKQFLHTSLLECSNRTLYEKPELSRFLEAPPPTAGLEHSLIVIVTESRFG
jgi:hypothetical protein